jgi:hypothetical protein
MVTKSLKWSLCWVRQIRSTPPYRASAYCIWNCWNFRYQTHCILAKSLYFLSHDIPNLLPRILTLFIYQVTWTILYLPLPSPHPTTASTFNHTSVRHGISFLQMVASSTKIAVRNSVFWGVALYDSYTECQAMKKDSVTICTEDVLILRVPKSSRNMRVTWYMMWYICRKARQ